ncbi:metal dependent phosphohydrolase [Desulfosporosinus sp. I2]|uniref:HD-GYP domain-containing protein n=1 Tax=Desulfosporosinus sp. I2 TaxID=1617025 RepID=UPI0005EED56A|nr:HD-GYP domain-containing protein [Desulfosporosinus sp. I2]KJR46687.1 metal dependent phosphohydrolase [Desulfosporosinus sp. I2]
MRIISVENLEEGMEIGRTIHGENGTTLLAAGVELTSRFINRLKELGIASVYIRDDAVGEIEIDDVVSERTRLEALKVTKEVMSNINLNSSSFDIQMVNDVVDNIINELLANRDIVVNVLDIRAINDFTYGHSVSVAILSIITGIAMGYDHTKLSKLAAGALLHDIGKSKFPEHLLNKVDPLNEEEEQLFQGHTIAGFEILKNIREFSLAAAHVALQHHERYDGTGYPRQLKGEGISEFARIVTVADIYDKMTTSIVGRPRCMPFQALEIIMANRGIFLDPEVVEHFMNIIALFPVGTTVLLNTGEKAVVIQTSRKHPTRPEVRVFIDRDGKLITPPYEINLVYSSNYFITRVIEEG